MRYVKQCGLLVPDRELLVPDKRRCDITMFPFDHGVLSSGSSTLGIDGVIDPAESYVTVTNTWTTRAAALIDGNTNQADSAAALQSGGEATLQLEISQAIRWTQVQIWAPNNASFHGGDGATRDFDVSANGTDWTNVATSTANINAGASATMTCADTSLYEYARVRTSSIVINARCAEMQFSGVG